MKRVPGGAVGLPGGEGLAGLSTGDAIVAGNEEEERRDDRECPEDDRREQERELRWLPPMQPKLREQTQETKGIPEWHDAAEDAGDGGSRGDMRGLGKPADDGMDEGGDGELIADHQASHRNGDEVR